MILPKLSSCIARLSNRPSSWISEWCCNIPGRSASAWRWNVQRESVDRRHYTGCDLKTDSWEQSWCKARLRNMRSLVLLFPGQVG